jgi:WXG100 family type VII secretion target
VAKAKGVLNLADKIKISPDDFNKATAELRRIEGLLNDYKAELSGKYAMMMNDWRGAAGEAFEACGQKVLNNFALNIENLSCLAAEIEQASQYMKEVDQQIAGAITFA